MEKITKSINPKYTICIYAELKKQKNKLQNISELNPPNVPPFFAL